jgi:ubiquinone biosynthesis protein COQ9
MTLPSIRPWLHNLRLRPPTTRAAAPSGILCSPRPRHRNPSRRPYHSYDRPASPSPFSPLESHILSAAYAQVPAHGFSAAALAAGCQDAGYVAATSNIFSGAAYALVRYHLYVCRAALASSHALSPSTAISLSERVRGLAWARLVANRPVVAHLPGALALMAQPTNVPSALRELALLADEIVFLAGDVSVDGGWYGKRAAVSAVYAASELHMSQDVSDGWQDTQQFLLRRWRETEVLQHTGADVARWVGWTASAAVNVLRSKGLRI